MIILANARKSIDYKGFITQNVHPAEIKVMMQFSVGEIASFLLIYRHL